VSTTETISKSLDDHAVATAPAPWVLRINSLERMRLSDARMQGLLASWRRLS